MWADQDVVNDSIVTWRRIGQKTRILSHFCFKVSFTRTGSGQT